MNKVASFSRSLAIAVACFIGSVQGAGATTITFEATNLKDSVLGQDLWMYTYFVSDAKFGEEDGFAIFFNQKLYDDLSISPKTPGAPDWDPIIIQPDDTLPSDGYLDALALVTGPSLTSPFIVTFNWLGGAGMTPGVQRFEVYADLDTDHPIEKGLTRPARTVPEPSTLLLSGLGLALASRFRRRRS
jgi:hypothetical protein